VIAYKFLRPDRVAPFTRFRWTPGEWVAAEPGVVVCERGVHACRAEALPYWIDRELWGIELDGEIAESAYKVAAERARLLDRLETWDEAARVELGRACAARPRELTPATRREPGDPQLAAMAADLDRAASEGRAATACYIAAVIAERSGGLEARRAERALQAAWFVENILGQDARRGSGS